jgi:hypothetical protein
MKSVRLLLRLALVMALATAVAPAQKPTAAGHWEGNVQAPDGPVPMTIDLDRNEKGEWVGDLDAPSRNVMNLPLAKIVIEGAAISFELSGFPAKVAASLSEDGQSISGTLTFREDAVPLQLKRTGPPKVTLPPKSSPLSKELEGRWEGTLEAGGQSFRLVLKLSKAADGTATGAMDSVDQGASNLALAGIVIDGPALRFQLPMVGGSYSGKLNTGATELAGEWTQGGRTLPLTFKRAAPAAEEKE